MEKHILNKYFDEIFVINLKKRKDRFIEVNQKLNRIGLHFTIIEAVDGYSKENRALYNKYLSIPIGGEESHALDNTNKRKTIKSPGAIGYLKSYSKIINISKINKYKRILVFDDDIILRKNFNTEVKKFLERLKSDWKICMLGATQHVWKPPISHKFVDEINKVDYYPQITDGSFALGISEQIFDELLEKIEKYNIAFDSGVLRDLYKKYNEQCIVAYPYLVIADVSNSDIANNRDQYELSLKLKWDIESFDYPFKLDLVSVIVPTYNKERYLEKSITSLLIQTYSNIEILIQDDYSTDKTKSICKQLSLTDKRIKYDKNDKNQGCYITRNNALNRSLGKYIAIHDPDEISLQNRITNQVYDIIQNNVLFSIGHVRRSRLTIEELFIGNDDDLLEKVDEHREPKVNGNFKWIDRKILGLQTSMFKRKVFIDYGLFWEERFSADAEILERILSDRLGILFPYNNKNIYQYLFYEDGIDGIYKKNDNVLCVSPIMDEQNLTNKYIGNIRTDFEKKWRSRLKGEYFYPYPRFNDSKSNTINLNPYSNKGLDNKSNNIIEINKLKIKLSQTNLTIQNLEKKLEYQKQKQIETVDWYRKEIEKINKWHEANYKNLPKVITKVSRAVGKIKNKKYKNNEI